MLYICENCRKSFNAPPSQKARFCSRDCYDKSREGHFVCLNCGDDFIDYKCRNRTYCSDECQRKDMTGISHPRWKGGKQFYGNGHIKIYQPWHPFAKNKYVPEHRLVMEKHVHRYLESEEIVHHINFNPADNRIENLQIVTRAEHVAIHKPHTGHFKK